MSTLFVVDGPHALFRSCYAHAELTYERRGELHKSGGVFGFLQMVRCAHRDLGGEAIVVVAWEDPRRHERSVRRLLYPEYKQKLKPEDEVDFGVVELRQFVREQQKLLSPVLTKIGIPQAFAPAWEADDVAAVLCHELQDHEVVLLSGDKDWWQLVSDRVTVMRPLKEGYQLVTPKIWEEEHKVAVATWPQVLALAGDDADNIPGVRNIGFKTAEKLLVKHGGFEGVIAAAAAGEVERFGLKNFDKRTGAECPGIVEMQDQLRLNLKLTTLNRNADLIWTKPEQDEDEVARRFREMKFASFTSYADLQSVMSMGVASW